LIPEQNIFLQRERNLVLKRYLSEHLGIAVTFTRLSLYGNIIERFTAERMDGAFFGSFTYALAHRQLDVEPIARPINLDGTSTYHGNIFARKDSGINRIADMRGKRFAYVERATTAGYLLPLAYFRASGIQNPQQYLGESFFRGKS
jgi:phosphonate transport system substrate-binding protein